MNVFWGNVLDVLKTCLEDVLGTGVCPLGHCKRNSDLWRMTSTWHIHVRWMSRLLWHQNTISFYTHLKVDIHTNSPFVSSHPGIFRLQHRICQSFSCYISLPCHEWSDVTFITFPHNQCRYYFNDPSQLPFWASFYNPVKHGYIISKFYVTTPNYNLCCKRRVRWHL